jgi:hypothetical protein
MSVLACICHTMSKAGQSPLHPKLCLHIHTGKLVWPFRMNPCQPHFSQLIDGLSVGALSSPISSQVLPSLTGHGLSITLHSWPGRFGQSNTHQRRNGLSSSSIRHGIFKPRLRLGPGSFGFPAMPAAQAVHFNSAFFAIPRLRLLFGELFEVAIFHKIPKMVWKLFHSVCLFMTLLR